MSLHKSLGAVLFARSTEQKEQLVVRLWAYLCEKLNNVSVFWLYDEKKVEIQNEYLCFSQVTAHFSDYANKFFTVSTCEHPQLCVVCSEVPGAILPYVASVFLVTLLSL